MSTFLPFIAVLLSEVSGYRTCQSPYDIEEYTLVSTDSRRDYESAQRIFPHMNEHITHVVDGMCANQMSVELPFTCFKLHARTWPKDEELQTIKTVEQHYVDKWQSVMSTKHNSFHYDAFLDFSISFFVSSLDPYLQQWQSLSGEPLHYIGIQWVYGLEDIDLEITSTDYKNNMFYSLLVHSPESSINYEFISFIKPSDVYYDAMKWIKSDTLRATFKTQNDPYPWDREDKATIVPLRISRGTTDIADVIDFYRGVMESQILYQSDHVIDALDGDNINTKTAFLSILEAEIELQFVERPMFYTAGAFHLEEYEQILVDAHNKAIISPYCGMDPWLSNHYALSTPTTDGYVDRILDTLNEHGSKYRVYKSTKYTTFIVEPTGQSIQIMGDVAQEETVSRAPLWNEEWCDTECVNEAEEEELHLFGIGSVGQEHHEKYLLGTLTGMTCGLVMCGVYYFYKKWKKRRFIENLMNNHNNDGAKTPLITKP